MFLSNQNWLRKCSCLYTYTPYTVVSDSLIILQFREKECSVICAFFKTLLDSVMSHILENCMLTTKEIDFLYFNERRKQILKDNKMTKLKNAYIPSKIDKEIRHSSIIFSYTRAEILVILSCKNINSIQYTG